MSVAILNQSCVLFGKCVVGETKIEQLVLLFVLCNTEWLINVQYENDTMEQRGIQI